MESRRETEAVFFAQLGYELRVADQLFTSTRLRHKVDTSRPEVEGDDVIQEDLLNIFFADHDELEGGSVSDRSEELECYGYVRFIHRVACTSELRRAVILVNKSVELDRRLECRVRFDLDEAVPVFASGEQRDEATLPKERLPTSDDEMSLSLDEVLKPPLPPPVSENLLRSHVLPDLAPNVCGVTPVCPPRGTAEITVTEPQKDRGRPHSRTLTLDAVEGLGDRKLLRKIPA